MQQLISYISLDQILENFVAREPGWPECKPCLDGTYKPDDGADLCLACPKGKLSPRFLILKTLAISWKWRQNVSFKDLDLLLQTKVDNHRFSLFVFNIHGTKKYLEFQKKSCDRI